MRELLNVERELIAEMDQYQVDGLIRDYSGCCPDVIREAIYAWFQNHGQPRGETWIYGIE